MKYLAVKGFDRFQHYRDRNPPWIKLHGTILTDLAFLEMPEAAQAQLVKLWVLASQLGHPLPNNPKLLAGKIGTTGRFHLATIVAAGFLIPCNEIASNPLAELEHDARPSVRARGQSSEIEIEPPSSAAAEGEAGLAVMLDNDADRVALTSIVARSRSRMACLGSLTSILTGNDPSVRPAPSAGQFGQALRDFASNGETYSAALFRGYLKRACRPEADVRQPSRGGVAQRTWNNGVAALKDL